MLGSTKEREYSRTTGISRPSKNVRRVVVLFCPEKRPTVGGAVAR